MLGTGEGVWLRLAGACAILVGLQAWRHFQRAREDAPAGAAVCDRGPSQPLLGEERAEPDAEAAEGSEDAAPRPAEQQVAAVPPPPRAQEAEAEEAEVSASSLAVGTPELREEEALAAADTAAAGPMAGVEQEADSAMIAPAGAAAAAVPPAAAALEHLEAVPAQAPPAQQQQQKQEQQQQQQLVASADVGSDLSDVPPGPLGSPFSPPWLEPAPDAGAVMAQLGLPPGGLLAAREAAAPDELASASAGSSSSSLGLGLGLGPGPPPAAPVHRRRRSLLSESLEEDVGAPAAVGGLTAEDGVLAALAGPAELDEHGRTMPTGLSARGGAAAAAAAAWAAAPPAGRPVVLRVELPEQLEEQRRQQQLAQQAQQAPAAQPQQPQLLLQPLDASSRGGTPLGFQQQQALAAAAAAEAAVAAAALQVQQRQQQPQPAMDSVAAALQRAVEMAASGSSSGALGGGGGTFGGFPAVPPGGAPGGHPAASHLRATLSGGTFRSGTLPAPPGVGSAVGRYGGASDAGGDLAHGDGGWADLGGPGFSMLAERSASMRSDHHLPRLSEEVVGVRMSMEVDVPLACKLDVIAGPCTGHGYTNTEDVLEVVIGRNQGVTMQLNDGEVSGQHAAVRWSSVDKCWKVADLGSLNGTLLNGEQISVAGRKRGRDYRLSSDDILQLGSFTKIKVSTFPRDLLDPLQSRCGSLPVGSMPKSLTMPKHRIPSFSSLLSPKITNTPSKKATVAAASDELRLECCIISRTGRDHQRKGQTCEDVACAECPLHGSEEALGGNPAALFCVFDGHCGRGAADAASTSLPDQVSQRLPGVQDALAQSAGAAAMLHEAFLATDQAISAEEGCTATAVLMWRDAEGAVCLQAANVGDSAALFIDPLTGAVAELTEDHRLTNPRERQRLQDMGIQLASNARRLYGLNLCRGLGDKFLKDEDLGLSAEPHVSGVVRLEEQQGGILLIASDGLWDVADPEAVAAAICQADSDKDGNVLETTSAVIGHALKNRTKDDVTALVVRVWPASEWELRSPTKNLDDGEAAAFVS